MLQRTRSIKNNILFIKFSPLIVVVILFIGCHRMAPGIQFLKPSDMQAEIERFKQAKGISCSDIPVIYDSSPLKVGSMVKSKMVNSQIPDKSFLSSTTLNDIAVTGSGEQYHIKTDTDGIGNYQYIHNKLSSKIICIDETETEPEYDIQLKWGEDIQDILAKERRQIITDVVSAGIMGGPLAASITAYAGMQKYNITKEVHEKFPGALQEMEARTEKETKLINFKLITEEKLIISGRPIPCMVYQVDSMIMIQSPSYNKGVLNFQEFANIMYESKKMWVADEIPFGIARSEMKTYTISQSNSQVIKTDEANIIFEVVEFKY